MAEVWLAVVSRVSHIATSHRTERQKPVGHGTRMTLSRDLVRTAQMPRDREDRSNLGHASLAQSRMCGCIPGRILTDGLCDRMIVGCTIVRAEDRQDLIRGFYLLPLVALDDAIAR